MAVKCGELKNSLRSSKERFINRQLELEKEFDALSNAADDRRRQLENAVHLYQYLRESHDLEAWINEQLQIAMSEDYGQDYEHLKVYLSGYLRSQMSLIFRLFQNLGVTKSFRRI